MCGPNATRGTQKNDAVRCRSSVKYTESEPPAQRPAGRAGWWCHLPAAAPRRTGPAGRPHGCDDDGDDECDSKRVLPEERLEAAGSGEM